MTDHRPPVRHWPLPVLGLALTAVGLGWTLVVGYLIWLGNPLQVTDFQVYREAVGFWLGGGDLYQFLMVLPDGWQLPFTYPPFAAILMLPTTWLPLPVGWLLSVILQLACLLIATILLARRTGVLTGLGRPEAVAIIGAGWLVVTASEPSLHGISLGQVSLILIVGVILDAVAVPPRWRGLLTGLAAAVKLTPGIVLVYFLLTRQWRAAVNAVVGGLVATAIGFIVLPAASWQYWTSLLFDTSRVGEPDVTRNKSLLGLLSHLGTTGSGRTVVWVGLAAIVVVIGLWQARRSDNRGTPLAAVLTVGLISTVISPVSWPHHLVWLPLSGLYLAFCPGRRRWLGLGLLVAFLAGTPLLSYDSGLPPTLAAAGDVITVVLLAGALFGVPGRPGGESLAAGPSRPPS